ncbi:MAG: phosphoribosylformylglycinamidine synthase subunit PurS, partial [Chloroflexi bacterium]|nr:phosphoribosylformylglycinamidine synthase subunit PurS [Chloroflexota bacterium]MCI0730080.1 phosphoribosylformylglycinamidine synthase subunit PurS [Chloroflexota bacterium]
MEQTETQTIAPATTGEQIYRIEVGPAADQTDTTNHPLLQAAHQLGLTTLTHCHTTRLIFLQGHLTPTEAHRLAQELLADPVTERAEIGDWRFANLQSPISNLQSVEVTLLPGVTDPPAENLVRAAHLLGMAGVRRAATGQRYLLAGELDEAGLHRLATELLANPVIQRFTINEPITPPFFAYQEADGRVETISLREAGDEELLAISRERRLALNLAEMQAIRDYYREEGRDPTDVELEMLAQTWSEHCIHKTFRATIEYTGPDGRTEIIPGLLKTTIRAATEKVNKPWVRSAFVDNAGIVAFDDHFDLAFKVETHNHPSALEPFGGANTGVGGVVRDVLGVSARPIANTDVLCFGPPDPPPDAVPAGTLHPRRVASGVVHGIEDYGNKMGIPTVNGAILYHPGYTANPLVYCGCLGLLPRGAHRTQAQPGDLIVAIGGRTGRDGLRGATFSSMEMDTTTGEIAGTAVQIGHPIQEKQVLEVVLRARDERLYNAITDCGAGGFSSAVGEMGEKLGAHVQLQNAPLKYPGLRPWEIWLSEAQERMILAVPPDNWPRLQQLCTGQDVEAIVLGHFESTGRLRLFYGDRLAGDLSMPFLHNGLPPRHLKAVWGQGEGETRRGGDKERGRPGDIPTPPQSSVLGVGEANSAHSSLLALLAHPNICSKEEIIRRYDHEVQGGAAVKPLVGAANHGPS